MINPDSPRIDKRNAILEVAGEVLAEYGDDQGSSRIERMARYILLNLGEPCVAIDEYSAVEGQVTGADQVKVRYAKDLGLIHLVDSTTFLQERDLRTLAAVFITAAEIMES